ncbi:MAG: terminase large subunit, partial [Gammaproteobacteria bacterium]|nr:terminase large subunit [Gammaproteobacteria bacterium]
MAHSSDRVDEYVDAVLSGDIVAGPHVRNGCKRHLKDLKRRAFAFDKDSAAHIIDYFEEVLCLGEGQFDGLPFNLDISQAFNLGSVFGWKVAKTGRRRFRRWYLEEGKGNGKSPLLAGVGLYGMTADDEKGAQVYSAAATKEQASVIFQDAVRMTASSPMLAKRITKSGRTPAWHPPPLTPESFFP